MADPRFFRRYLDILDEQEPTSATVNFDDNTSATVDTAAKTLAVQTKIGDLDLKATHDRSAVPSNQISANYQLDPNLKVGGTHTQAGYKGQMTPTTQISANYDNPDVGKIDTRLDKGAMFQGAGKNIRQGNPVIATTKVTNPQGQTATYSTNRNL